MKNIVIHYSEIALKGNNRGFFERALINNIKGVLGEKTEISRGDTRLFCEIKDENDRKKLGKIPGIAYFSFAEKSTLDLNELKKISLDILKNKKFNTFCVRSKRSNKAFSKTSPKLNEIIGGYIVEKLGKKVNLKNPDITLYIEICNKEAFLYCEKCSGVGGLPVGSGSKLICSLSGGIDSPVAAFHMMKRGCEIIFVHIYNKTQTSSGLLGKIKSIVKELTNFQLRSKLYVIPFEDIQKKIIMEVPSKFRMIIYRRFMLKIINKIAEKEKIKGIVTGDSIGQVASQTVENLRCIYDASELPVFSPLIGMNKEEIMDTANKIGTFETSIISYPDCCSFMIAKHPETKANLEKIRRLEDNIKDKEKLVKESVDSSEVFVFEK